MTAPGMGNSGHGNIDTEERYCHEKNEGDSVWLMLISVLCSGALAQTTSDRAEAARARESGVGGPVVRGHGVGLFEIGPLLVQDDFENLENWVVQVQERSGVEPAHVEARDNSLDCLLPGRGCTVWFKKKLSTRVTIIYDVLCPTHEPAIKGVQPRDINNFWMATDPDDPERGLFDSERYTGQFSSYDKMHGYYASTGGRDNQTTRMRRYPRETLGEARRTRGAQRQGRKAGLSDHSGQGDDGATGGL